MLINVRLIDFDFVMATLIKEIGPYARCINLTIID